jgi:hypothetical protein
LQVAASLNVTPSPVSQMFKASVQRIATLFGHDGKRATDLISASEAAAAQREMAVDTAADEARRIALREAELAAEHGSWGEMVEAVLTQPGELFDDSTPEEPLRVDSSTRWG